MGRGFGTARAAAGAALLAVGLTAACATRGDIDYLSEEHGDIASRQAELERRVTSLEQTMASLNNRKKDTAFFRDVAQLLGMLLNAWFYLTPIVYPLPLVPERFRGWLELNPLTTLVELYRQALLEGSVALVPRTAPLALGTAVILFAGFWLFRRLKPAFVDEI